MHSAIHFTNPKIGFVNPQQAFVNFLSQNKFLVVYLKYVDKVYPCRSFIQENRSKDCLVQKCQAL